MRLFSEQVEVFVKSSGQRCPELILQCECPKAFHACFSSKLISLSARFY